ncbi:hypothetical protein DPMN_091855 [Dreissena polymorpha]|uniref:Uncharacterized protein n=1 Tax=Dreissena polymorpha TaxID=45954 RepID=A0A9D4R0D0_DREPO|nr:hypothetical protein DPMN_091855 [Dreissena polymorpha]
MAPLVVTGRRLHPRDSFPSALSVLSTAVPGSLSKATPRCSWNCFKPFPPDKQPQVRPYVLHTGGLAVPLFPSLYRLGPLADPGQRALDEKQRVTNPLHLGEDRDPSSVEDVRLESHW